MSQWINKSVSKQSVLTHQETASRGAVSVKGIVLSTTAPRPQFQVCTPENVLPSVL